MGRLTYVLAEARGPVNTVVVEHRPGNTIPYSVKVVSIHGFKTEAAAADFARKFKLSWEPRQ